MKESITKFDLEAAFKALDEIDVPVTKGIKANKAALTEIFSRKTKFEALMEEYYDINDMNELGDAKEAREAEVAKAKLARIEKIVDLEADSPEDLLTSYVGKYIMQCPQCMTLFYKDPEDVVEAEDDPETVNVNEVCQHCGNESGYMLIGKVGEATPEEAAEEFGITDEELPVEEEMPEVPAEEEALDDLGDLEELDLDIEDDEASEEEEKKEESFATHEGETLVEELADDADLDAKLEAHSEYIEYLRAAISQEEKALEKATNEQVKVAIQRNIDAFKVDLENALPEAVKNDIAIPEEPVEEEPIEEMPVEGESEAQEESYIVTEVNKALTEELHEEADLDVSADEFEELINSPEFKKPISDTAVRAMMDSEKESEEAVEESLEDEALEEGIFDKVKDGLSSVKNKLTKFIDTQIKSRASGADWVLKNALVDYSKATLKNDGSIEASKDNQKFATFLVVGYTDTGKNKQKIKEAPKHDSTNLVVGMKYPEVKQNYADAEKVAKGWSMVDGNGPAFIYLAKNAEGDGAAFLCQYFKGQLDAKSDQLENYIEKVKNSITGGKLQAQSGADQADTKNLKASEVKPGMKAKFKKGAAEIIEIKDSDIRDGKNISIKFEDGSTRDIEVSINDELVVMRDSIKNESFDNFMAGLEELHEASLEKLISDSLVEAYGNVAGYRLTGCEYLNEKLNVNGTVYFTSGNTRKLTYAFSEACMEEDKVKLQGLNEKLGLDKKFTLIGRIDNTNKTLITESFSNK